MDLSLFHRFENHVGFTIFVVNVGESRKGAMDGRTHTEPSLVDESSVSEINFNFSIFSVLGEGLSSIVVIIDVYGLWCLIFDS